MLLLNKHAMRRRSFLRGAGGVAVGLPFLECMLDSKRARAQGMPLRTVMMYAGQSIGYKQPIQFEPEDFGPAFTTTECLRSLNGEHGDLRGDVSVVTGLRIPYAQSNNPDDVMPMGRVAAWHDSTRSVLTTGLRATSTDSFEGPTADWILRDTLGRDPLSLRVQVDAYRGGGRGQLSYRGVPGDVSGVEPFVSPRVLWNTLFQNLAVQDPAEAEAQRKRILRDQSILDVIRDSADRLRGRLGTRDQQRLNLHFEAIRELELRVDAVPPPTVGVCARPDDPGADPGVELDTDQIATDEGQPRQIGFGREDLRARLMADMTHMAFACGVENNVSFQISFGQTFINAEFLCGKRTDIHELSHFAGTEVDHAKTVNWHVDTFAYLTNKLKNTEEGNGTLLDHTSMSLLFEGGWGYDPESGAGSNDEPRAHSSENMAVLVSGRAGGLVPKGHIRVEGAHPAQALLSCMRAVGYDGSLGEVDSEMTDLF
jgi:hypothetical protein